MQRIGIEGPVCDQDAHRIDREARQLDTGGRPAGREIAEEHAQRVLGAQLVVAIGEDQKGTRLDHAAGQEFDEIDGRFIGPVNILEDEERRLRGIQKLIEHGGEHGSAADLALELRLQLAADLPRDVVERAERRRREQRVAISLEDAHSPGVGREETIDEGCLSDAGFAADKRDPALPGRGLLEDCGECLQLVFPLEEIRGQPSLYEQGRGRTGHRWAKIAVTGSEAGKHVDDSSLGSIPAGLHVPVEMGINSR